MTARRLRALRPWGSDGAELIPWDPSLAAAAAPVSGWTYSDIFCGLGGSSIGLAEAGGTLVFAANHDPVCIDTHSANFKDAEHVCADVTSYLDMRCFPKTDVGWFSPICTELSPAGGTAKPPKGQLELFGHVSKQTFVRTRATFWDVVRATEVNRYKIVIVENVPEAADWELFDIWLQAMKTLRPGYEVQFVSVSSAHVGGDDNPYAPQWRDRLYMVFSQKGIRQPDVEPRPLAWCFTCEQLVRSMQAWKRPMARHIGKYGRQYVYVCERTECGHAVAEPLVLPALYAIDWSDPGTRIGDRKKTAKKPEGLAPSTMARIRAGMEMFPGPVTLAVGGNTYERPGSGYVRAWPVGTWPMTARNCTPEQGLAVPDGAFLTLLRSNRIRNTDPRTDPLSAIVTEGAQHCLVLPVGGNRYENKATTTGEPLAARTCGDTDALVSLPGFVTMLRTGSPARGLDVPLSTLTTGRNHGLTMTEPFLVKNYGGNCTARDNVNGVSEPMSSVTCRDGHALVIPPALVVPYRGRRSHATPASQPMHTVATHDSGGFVHGQDGTRLPVEAADCYFRMLRPWEHAAAQRVPRNYAIKGNHGEMTMQAGNAVSCNVAHALGDACAAVL